MTPTLYERIGGEPAVASLADIDADRFELRDMRTKPRD